MAIDTNGKWWKGTAPEDVRAYLEAYAEDGYQMHDFRSARCPCGGVAFRLEADADEGVARRTCTLCGGVRFIADSEEYWSDADPEVWNCVDCGSEVTNVGVGFSLYGDQRGIRWVYVGARCTRCGILGCFAEWKVGKDDPSIIERA
jgi:hypothetical protein